MKKSLFVGSVAALSLAAGAAQAQTEIVLSGQVTPVLLFGGDVEDPEIADNTGTGSRVRLRGKTVLNDALTGFMRYEIQFQENQSFGALDGSESIDTRYAEVGVRGSFGSISLGKGDGAANNTGEGSYQVSGNILGGGHLPFFATRGVLNRDNDANVLYTQFDVFSRNSRLRYDAPTFGGLALSASLTNNSDVEFAARFKRDVGPGKLTLLFGIGERDDDAGQDRLAISGGYKFDFGLSFAGSFETAEVDDGSAPDLESSLLSLNYSFGKAVASIDFGASGEDRENTVIQAGAEYHFSKHLDLYGGISSYTNEEANADGSDQDLTALFTGFRYKY